MTNANIQTNTSETNGADETILGCLNPKEPKSFFLYAGAGSGKTRSLVKACRDFRDLYGPTFRLEGRTIGIITYTNAARDEIERRLGLNPLFDVSTIHSFCWTLIKGVQIDIRSWLEEKLQADIAELEEKQAKGRAGTKVAYDRERRIASKRARLERLSEIRKFTYNPNGDNFSRDSLSHSEVIQITSDLLESRPLMQKILISRCPFLLIDESQDTNRDLMEALLSLEEAQQGRFALGLFGDTMQRIYGDGKIDLGQNLPDRWKVPEKTVNYRSSRRVIELGNCLRGPVDGRQQKPWRNALDGIARLFIIRAHHPDKPSMESHVRTQMAEITGDELWSESFQTTKTLALEHRMVAARMDFLEMFDSLYSEDRLKRGVLDGDLAGVRLFSGLVMPLVDAWKKEDKFTVASILKKSSPLLAAKTLKSNSFNQREALVQTNIFAEEVVNAIEVDSSIRFLDVLHLVAEHQLFDIPESLESFVSEKTTDFVAPDENEKPGVVGAWRAFLEAPFSQIRPYVEYISDDAIFDTHHGVKGLEFKRVMVLMDDEESRGFLYSYEKLFGVTEKTDTDKRNESEGKETGIDRTRRLLYVTCTRAEQSLALVVYSDAPERAVEFAITQGWFQENEVSILH